MEGGYILNGNPNRKIDDYYDVSQQVLGKGTYGTVYLAKVKGSNTARAVKVIQKDKVNNVERFKCEVDIMKSLVRTNLLRTIPTSFAYTISSRIRRMCTSCWSRFF